MEKGMEKGKNEMGFEIAKKMKSKNKSVDEIIEYTGLTKAQINNL